ncbi:hypothetical protein M0804_014707 [Polistes exclamans]|nr:hypothetical protein M0804_014707 [Polistes exclamans]
MDSRVKGRGAGTRSGLGWGGSRSESFLKNRASVIEGKDREQEQNTSSTSNSSKSGKFEGWGIECLGDGRVGYGGKSLDNGETSKAFLHFLTDASRLV